MQGRIHTFCDRAQVENSEIQCCYACGQHHVGVFVERVGAFTMLECPACGLQYASPMSYSARDYDSSYSGCDTELVKSYATSMEANRLLAKKRDYFNGNDSKEMAFQYVKDRFSRDDPILDLGCGAGAFLAALEDAGFSHAMGMDVAEAPIKLLSREGFTVAQGILRDYPADWPAPEAVLMIEVLEHLPNPVETLTEVRTRFPKATLVATVPSPNRIMLKYGPSLGDRPPNHLTRWTELSLSTALKNAGYCPNVRPGPLQGHSLKLPFEDKFFELARRTLREGQAPQPTRKQRNGGNEQYRPRGSDNLASRATRLLARYKASRGRRDFRQAKDILLYPFACYYRWTGYTGSSLVAVGYPSTRYPSAESSLKVRN